MESTSTSTTFDFEDGNGLVPSHQHKNPNGSLGGWVAETASVTSTCCIGPKVRVYENVQVSGKLMFWRILELLIMLGYVDILRFMVEIVLGNDMILVDRNA